MNKELMAIEKNNIMTQIGFNLNVPIKIYVDNVSAINLVGKNMIKLEYCRSEYQIADISTKPLKINVFIKLRDLGQIGRLFQIRIKGGC